MTTPSEVALLRLAAQRLVGPPCGSEVDVVRRLTAVQAQDLPGALTSVALRSTQRSRAAVEAALEAGQVVRSWPMRGTLHLVVAEDLQWMLRLMTPRVIAASAGRRAALGLTQIDLDRAADLARSALGAHGQLGRRELAAAWTAGGVSPHGQRGLHILQYLAMTGTLVLGPTRDGEQLVVLVDDWIPNPRRLDRDESLGELALRYFSGHGPATLKDLVRWGQLRVADARTGLALARDRLDRLDVDGTGHWLHPATPEVLAAAKKRARGVVLLPGFDEFVLGYADRSAQLDPRFAALVCPGGNGMFRATVVSGGQVVGTWRHGDRGSDAAVRGTEPFETFTAAVLAALPRAFAALP